MNKKANVISALGYLTLVCIVFIMGFYLSIEIVSEYKLFKEYKIFCEDKPDFCYCNSWLGLPGSCEFKSQWSSQTGLSNETIQLCEIAKSLKDKEVLFKVGCYNE